MKEAIAVRVGGYYLTQCGVPVHCVQRWGMSFTMNSLWGSTSFVVDAEGASHHPGTTLAKEISKPPEDLPEASLMDVLGQAYIEGRKSYEAMVGFIRQNYSRDD